MKIRTLSFLLLSHTAVGLLGFALGIYFLPILIAPPAPSDAQVTSMAATSLYSTEFSKAREDSDSLHWGQGKVSLGKGFISLQGSLAPGPDYKLYLSPDFVETEAKFNQLKPSMLQVGEINTFDNFIVKLPLEVDLSQYNTVIVWCESFGQFISSGQYR